ncbi:MAG: GNAT family N-acetyltransferase [Filomicrobium sp.]
MREAFRERWLGRYLEHDPEWFYLASADGAIVGYLAGCVEDPATAARFSDIGYFQVWAGYTAQYPAHLHVNVCPTARDQGLGSRLVDRFVGDLSAAGVKGVHLVTGLHSRNVAFYQRNGFVRVADIDWNGSEIVMLGRLLG